MYAQTIAYGLFAARCETDNGQDFTREKSAYLIPKTNPFLRKLFNHIAGPDLDEHIVGAVDDLAQILAQADMSAVMKGFGKSTGKEDPVVHFYETFLKEYDPKTREMRGVYYTPLPIVSYIVRSIDHILKTRFEKPQGLADPSVLILDPAVGTATFLYMVMQEIHDAVIQQGQTGTWNDYVEDKLLPRLFGFELLMAPYVIAHLKLERLLKETGYQFQPDQRLKIYLTNTLGEMQAPPQQYWGMGRDLAEEGKEAEIIKREEQIVVVLGNPPYSKSVFEGKWIMALLDRYKEGLHEKKADLNREEWKFVRFAEWRIEKTGEGIAGFIINNSFLDGVSTRQMRKALIETFDEIYVMDLHGSVKADRSAPPEIVDQNVFDIEQGVTIIIMARFPSSNLVGKQQANVWHAELWATRDEKYKLLSVDTIGSTKWDKLSLRPPYYRFIRTSGNEEDEYLTLRPVNEIFARYSSGIQTKKDRLAIQDSPQKVLDIVKTFVSLSPEDARQILGLGPDGSGWNVADAQADAKDAGMTMDSVIPILYRPFDTRYTYYTKKSRGFLGRPRTEIMQHMLNHVNIGLITMRQTVGGEYSYSGVTNIPNCHGTFYLGNKGQDYLFPLYLYPIEKKEQPDKSGGTEGGVGEALLKENRKPNLNPDFIKAFSEKLGLKFIEDGKGDLQETFGPEDIFNYTYAVFHSPTYRKRYAEFLKIDFPRLPLTSDKALFKSLAEKGAVLVSLHLMESPLLNTLITKYPVAGDHQVEKVSYDEKTRRLYINKTEYFEGVPPLVWNFHIGGYQVCEKWLKDRQKAHRKLSGDDIDHYQKIVVALKETIRLMAEIDALIPKWPIE